MNIFQSHFLFAAVISVLSPLSLAQDAIVEDGEVTLSYDELAHSVEQWTPQMRNAAIQDEGDRLELINMTLANKKLALSADELVSEQPGLEQDYLSGLRAYQRQFVLKHYADSLEYPDFEKLAREQYEVNKDKYALVPEQRKSSHILFASPPGVPRDELMVEARAVLDQLRAGADFTEMVKQHSDEPNAAAKRGRFDRWVAFGEVGVSPPYSEGLFSIDKVGEYADLVQTEFGVHIIRLDAIKEKFHKSFDEVRPEIIAQLEAEYRQLAMKDFVSQFQMSEDTVIDNEAVEKILAPYKTGE